MTELRDVVEGLARRAGVTAVSLVSADGLVIDRCGDDELADADEIAALSATLARQAISFGSASTRGDFRAGVLEYAGGMAVLSRAGKDGFLVILTEPGHNVGPLLFDLQHNAPALAALL